MSTVPRIQQLLRSTAFGCRKNNRILLQSLGTKQYSTSSTGRPRYENTRWKKKSFQKTNNSSINNNESCRLFSSTPPPGGDGDGDDDSFDENANKEDPHAMFKEQMEQLKEERQDMYGFSEEEEDSWSNAGNMDKLPDSLMKSVEQARMAEQARTVESPEAPPPTPSSFVNQNHNTSNNDDAEYAPTHGLTHLSQDGSSVNMVDVGNKAVTQRMARAETRVIFPPEVVAAFQQSTTAGGDGELVGPKGPIFATAKIAGIMAAKKTSDLIPLCHPLPLDKVQIDIRLDSPSVVVITCECRVTHKTGVEMEALTGASVAALTIYDMVKAISHNIRIEQTILVGKSGGKRTID